MYDITDASFFTSLITKLHSFIWLELKTHDLMNENEMTYHFCYSNSLLTNLGLKYAWKAQNAKNVSWK